MNIITPPRELIEADRPVSPASLLSRSYRDRLIERGILGLYRWYTSRSQETRNWNPDSGFDWRNIRTDFSPQVQMVLEGFFAVEQYAPDYVSKFLHMVRRSHGRSHFQMRWGSEEEKHADTWENAVLFSKSRTPAYLEDYKYQLRTNEWKLPWDDALHVLLYTVFQERATQLNYLNLAKVAVGKPTKDEMLGNIDPVLAKVSVTIAADEAAHYNFFLECAKLFMYYYPLETLEAMRDVINHFAMPASDIVPNWDEFYEVAYRTAIYGPREYARDVVAVVFDQFGVKAKRHLEDGIKRTRLVPDEDGQMRQTAIWDTFDPTNLERDVQKLYSKIQKYEASYGMDQIDPVPLVPNPLWPTQRVEPESVSADD
jgi:acyl-[acyl-carrier-protein] desaturase